MNRNRTGLLVLSFLILLPACRKGAGLPSVPDAKTVVPFSAVVLFRETPVSSAEFDAADRRWTLSSSPRFDEGRLRTRPGPDGGTITVEIPPTMAFKNRGADCGSVDDRRVCVLPWDQARITLCGRPFDGHLEIENERLADSGLLVCRVVTPAHEEPDGGWAVAERDWVVVGATPEQMVALGYRPVGRDFPVFLHPTTHEEYALARTERKSGRGYRGFTIYSDQDVTLEQDLARRDLTMNAMAKDEAGELIDPFGGARDLKLKILRHVGEAFTEDPVRIVRTARFVARFSFRIADETLALMRHMVEHGEADHLVAERVWREFARGLEEAHPAEMLSALERCGALAKLVPELLPALEGDAR